MAFESRGIKPAFTEKGNTNKRTNGHTLSESHSQKVFMVSHSVVHMKNYGIHCERNKKRVFMVAFQILNQFVYFQVIGYLQDYADGIKMLLVIWTFIVKTLNSKCFSIISCLSYSCKYFQFQQVYLCFGSTDYSSTDCIAQNDATYII